MKKFDKKIKPLQGLQRFFAYATVKLPIMAGEGVTFFPEMTWVLEEKTNVEFLEFQPPCKRSVYVRWNRPYYKSYAARLFYNFLVEYFSTNPFL